MDLPNPVHGMSNVNLAILNKAIASGLQPKVINTVPSYAAKFFNSKVWGIFKVVHTLFCYINLFFKLLLNRSNVVYRPINGGIGQVYDLVYIVLCRLFFKQIFIHHHSFNYLNRRSNLFSLLNKLARNSTIHIVLGERMGNVLSELYNIDQSRIRVISNLAFFETANKKAADSKNNEIVIGHLANLCVEKGVGLFVDVCRNLALSQVDFKAKIAGPFADDIAKNIVQKSAVEIPQIEYVGPLYSNNKLTFYRSLYCFIFPSMYKNEAEPLVLYEAALHGAFLAGTRKGCMEDVIESLAGFSVEDKTGIDVAKIIADQIKLQIDQQGFSLAMKEKRLALFNLEQCKAKEALTSFMNEMMSYELPKTR